MNAMPMLLLVAATAPSVDWTAVIATEGAIVTMESAKEPVPPKPTPDTGSSAGPLATFREAKALIEKAGSLADRSKAVLDQAQRDGKNSVDTWSATPSAASPQARPQASASCPGGVCPVAPPGSPSAAAPPDVGPPSPQCGSGDCQPRMLWRRRQ